MKLETGEFSLFKISLILGNQELGLEYLSHNLDAYVCRSVDDQRETGSPWLLVFESLSLICIWEQLSYIAVTNLCDYLMNRSIFSPPFKVD